MCLGIPGQVVELLDDARAPRPRRRQRRGPGRSTSACSRTRHLAPGDWVLIHVGFAMSKIDEDGGGQLALDSLQMMGAALRPTSWRRWTSSRTRTGARSGRAG